MKKYVSPYPTCSICGQPLTNGQHTDPAITRLCAIRLAMINLRLEERGLRGQLEIKYDSTLVEAEAKEE